MRKTILLAACAALCPIACGGGASPEEPAEPADKDGTVGPEALDGVAVSTEGGADSANSPYQGELTLDERTVANLTKQRPYHIWTFTLEQDADVTVDLAARGGQDTFLFLFEWQANGWAYFAQNDDCPSGNTLNSCWEGALSEGGYALIATSYRYAVHRQRTAFEYHLTVRSAPAAQACGSRGLDPCPEGTFCDWDAAGGGASACGANDAPGACAPIPDACPAVRAPVCGCDGQTWGNECEAHMAGVDTASEGACAPPGQGEGEVCGGIAGFQCAEGLVCDYSANESCLADMAGLCIDVDTELPCTEEFAPVCGCDGQTYSNDCHRRAALVARSHVGVCEQ